MKTAAEDEVYRAANMTAGKRLRFDIRRFNAETDATTWSVGSMERVTIQLGREIYGITSIEQMRFKTDISIRMIDFYAGLESIGIHALRKRIEQRINHFGYPKMHLLSHTSESIRWMGSDDNFTINLSERLHIAKVKEAYRSSNKVNYNRQILKHNDDMEETLSYLALEGWYDVDSTKVINLLSATDKWQSTTRAHLLPLQWIQEKPIIRPVSQQLYYLRETNIRGVCRSIKVTSLRDTLEDFGIHNFGHLFHSQIEQDGWPKVCGLLLGYDQNVLIHSIFITLQNGLLYYRQPFHNSTSVERLGLDCKVEYPNANQGIMPEAHNISVQYMKSEENYLDNTFQGQIPSFPELYFC
jgi:hypothetical protein